MQLQLLFKTTCLTAYYDRNNDWLFLDWEGNLTLLVVQEACAELATCFLHRPYTHVLNSNEQVTGIHWNVTAWLATDFLPHVALAGIKHLAWIYSASLRGQNMVQTILSWLPGPIIDAFDNVADAVTWLQHTKLISPPAWSPRSAATQAKLTQEVQTLLERLQAKQLKLQQA